MPIPIHRSTTAHSKPPKAYGQPGSGLPAGFASSILLEKAEQLLRPTDQFSRWQALRQRNHPELDAIAQLVIRRDEVLANHSENKSTNWQTVQQITTELEHFGFHFPNTQSTPLPQATPPVSSGHPVLPAESLINEDFLLLLSARCPSIGLERDLIGYGDGTTTLLPLGAISNAVDFNIRLSPDAEKASGWFLDEEHPFLLDFTKKTLEIAGKNIPWPEGKITRNEGDIFVDSSLLSEWFPLDFTFSIGEMRVEITPRQQLPAQARYEREQQRKRLARQDTLDLMYPIEYSPYQLASFPVIDLTLNSGLETNTDGQLELKNTHSIIAEGDFAYMGGRVFIAGDEEHPLETTLFTLEKVDREGKLLGPLEAKRIALGDVAPVTLPILGARSSERGIVVSNSELTQSRDFDVTRFEGTAQNGWDVELYQNGNLIASSRVGTNGRYAFEDIPVYFGTNTFQILGHGPQGQKRIIETKNIQVGTGMLKEGALEYGFSASQQKSSLLNLDDTTHRTSGQGTPRISAQLAYGLTDNFTLTSGISSLEFEDTRHTYLQAGIESSLASVFTSANAIHDSAGGEAYSLQALTQIGPFNLRAKHTLFSDFIDERNPSLSIKERTSLGVNGRTPDWLPLPPLSYTLSSDRTLYETYEINNYSAQLSSRFSGVYLSNRLTWHDSSLSGHTAPDISGQFQATGSIGPARLVAGIDYSLDGTTDISGYRLSGFWPITQGISANADLLYGIDDNKQSSAQLGLNIDSGKITLTPSISCNSEGEYGAFVGLSLSFGQDPIDKSAQLSSQKRSGTGAISALVYHDKNNNLVFDEDDVAIPEARVLARQARKSTLTDEHGLAHFTSLQANSPTDVHVIPSSLQDPSWAPAIAGIATVPRKGTVNQIQLPVFTTGEIDGTLYHQDKNGNKRPLTSAVLKIVNAQGETVQKATSEYDGFYLFEQVAPGTYSLQIEQIAPQYQELAKDFSAKVTIGKDGTIVRSQDIYLQEPPPQTDMASLDTGSRKWQSRPTRIASAPTQTRTSIQLHALTLSEQPFPEQTAKNDSPPQQVQISPLDTMRSFNHFLPGTAAQPPQNNTPEARIPQPYPPGSVTKIRPVRLATPPRTNERIAIHLASYRSIETAKRGVALLKKRLNPVIRNPELDILRVDLGPEKGIYYRVLYGTFASKKQAQPLAQQFQAHTDYARPLSMKVGNTPKVDKSQPPSSAQAKSLNAKTAVTVYQSMQQFLEL